jgi:hypothetical protein
VKKRSSSAARRPKRDPCHDASYAAVMIAAHSPSPATTANATVSLGKRRPAPSRRSPW